jgi:hypothetical protein
MRRRGQKHGLTLAATIEALRSPGAELIASAGYYSVWSPERRSEQVQRRAFDAARTRGLLEFVAAPRHAGIWRLKTN